MYGFGCKLNGQTSHCYPIHQHFMCNEGFNGIENLMSGYLNFTCNNNLILSGPTNFSQIMNKFKDEIDVSKLHE